MKIRSHRSYLVSTAALVWLAVNFEGVAQQPQAPVPQSPAGQVQTPPSQAPPQGRRGGGGGRKDDPVNADVDWTKQPALLAKTPEEQLKTFILQPGYRLELVLADPIVQEPTAIAFDGNGRMTGRPRTFLTAAVQRPEMTACSSSAESSRGGTC